MFQEFKDFAMKGNLIDMAVAFVMGGAFATVVTAFIEGVFLPVLSPVLGGLDLSALTFIMSPAIVNDAGEVVRAASVIELGKFIAALISFLIVAFVMFMIIKGMNNMLKKKEVAPAEVPAPSRQEVLLEEIRNLLAKG